MEADKDPYVPLSMVLMGGPIDTRVNPNAVNRLAETRGLDWFRSHVITKVPFPHPGCMRDVYPGFLQLHGFVSMNLDRHLEAHRNLFIASGQGRRRFGAEASRVLRRISRGHGPDRRVLSADRRHRVHPPRAAQGRDDAIAAGRSIRARSRRVALMTVEGEHDDISAVGQTEAAHRAVRQYPGRRQGALSAAGRRPLRRVQRLALPRRDRPAHRRLRAVAQRRPRGCAQGARRPIEPRRRGGGCGRLAGSRNLILDRPMSLALRALLYPPRRASRRRSRSTSTARSMPCGCAATRRRAATRCASMPPRREVVLTMPPRGSVKAGARLRAEARRLDRGAARPAAASRRRSPRHAAAAARRRAPHRASAGRARHGLGRDGRRRRAPALRRRRGAACRAPRSPISSSARPSAISKRRAAAPPAQLGVTHQARVGARPVEPLGLVLDHRRAVLFLAAHSGAAFRARLSRRARGGASGRDEPLAQVLAAGRAASTRDMGEAKAWLDAHGADLHRYGLARV